MKYLSIVVTLFFIFKTAAQDPQLFKNNWYLEELVVGGIFYPPPSNEEVPFVEASFSQDTFLTAVCDALGAGIMYTSTSSFTLNGGVTILGCKDPANQLFRDLYLETYYLADQATAVFSYTIEPTTGGLKTLIVEKDNGDTARYGNQLLTINSPTIPKYIVYPNPVMNQQKNQKSKPNN